MSEATNNKGSNQIQSAPGVWPVVQVHRAIDSPTCYVKDIFYAYNLDGSLKSLTYPSGRVMNYTYNAAGQPMTVTDGNTTQYVSFASYYPGGMQYQQLMPNIYFRTDVNQRLQINGLLLGQHAGHRLLHGQVL